MTERRQADTHILALKEDMDKLKVQMEEHRAVTEQVRDILASFRVIGAVAKWITGLTGACVAVWHLWHGSK
jgi:hypothetical protein